jgi:signal transduction histidine kinase
MLAIIILVNNIRMARLNLEIKVERNEMKGVIENLFDGIIAYDQNFKILVFNKAAERILNISASKVLGQIFSPEKAKDQNFSILGQILYPSLAGVVVRRSELGTYPQISDFIFNQPKLNLRVSTDRVVDPSGNLLGFVKIIRDRTREIEILKSKSEFIEVAAHQLRTPLTSINWIFESLSKESLAESQKEMVNMGQSAIAGVLKTVNDLLDVTQIEEGKFGYQMESVEITSFMEQLLGEMIDFAKESGVNLYLKKPEEKSIITFIDQQKLAIAISNIVSNAVKYNIEKGDVTIEIKKLEDKPFVQISIKDSGIGIEQNEINKLFTKFFRSENAKRVVPDGAGLGLYITKNIIKRHGGEIWAQSQLNRGSTFYFTLPLDPKMVPQAEVAELE